MSTLNYAEIVENAALCTMKCRVPARDGVSHALSLWFRRQTSFPEVVAMRMKAG